jgi:hypothetical protein
MIFRLRKNSELDRQAGNQVRHVFAVGPVHLAIDHIVVSPREFAMGLGSALVMGLRGGRAFLRCTSFEILSLARF